MKMSSAITDQAIFSGSNFVINVLLARWLTPDEYGAFVVAYAWFVFAHNIYEAVLVEPMSYYASDKYAQKFSKYMGYIFYGHSVISIIMIAVMLFAALIAHFLDSHIVTNAMAGAAIAAPFMSVRWLVRQPFYVQSKPQQAIWGGVIYCALAIPGLFFMHHMDWLSPFNVYLMMGASGAIASLVLIVGLIKPSWDLRDEEISTAVLLGDHLSYSKWSVAFRLLQWVQANIYYVLLPILATLATSGALRSINNLVYPLYMANSAISSVLLPNFVRTYNRNKDEFMKRVRDINILLFIVIGGYFLLIMLFGDAVINVMYDGQYDEYVNFPVLFTLGITPIAVVAGVVLTTALRAMGWVELTFRSKIIPTVLTLTVGILLVAKWGILGANLALLMNASVTLLLLWLYFRDRLQSDEVSPLIANKRNSIKNIKKEDSVSND